LFNFLVSVVPVLNALTKWWLEVVRNVVVVSILFFLASKSGAWYLWLLASLSFSALGIYIVTSIPAGQLRITSHPGMAFVGVAIGVALGLLSLPYILEAASTLVLEISQAQNR
jgi:hypothetical protein